MASPYNLESEMEAGGPEEECPPDECPDCGGKVKEGELCTPCHMQAEAELDAFFGTSK